MGGCNRIIKDNGAILLFSQMPFTATLVCSNMKMFRYEWIWQKSKGTGFLNANRMPMKQHENILVFYNKQPTYNPQMRTGFKSYECKQSSGSINYCNYDRVVTKSDGERFPVDVIQFNQVGCNSEISYHPTQKPLDLLMYLIKTYTNVGDTVLDFTMGSGSTGVACISTNRNFIGIELDNDYFKIAEKRIKEEQSQVKLF